MELVFICALVILVFTGILAMFLYPPHARTQRGRHILIWGVVVGLVSFMIAGWSWVTIMVTPCN